MRTHAHMARFMADHCKESVDLSKALEPPEEFPFPFQPYGIQRDFMRELYLALEGGKVGIFESPTGTVRYRCS